jgi:hypothetical protein
MRRVLVVLAATVLLLAFIAPTVLGDSRNRFRASLDGFKETPSVNTDGRGSFRARIEGDTLTYTLRYRDLTGTPLFAHIHFGQPDVAGGVVAFLCGGGGKPACPAGPATVTGTIEAGDVQEIASQGFVAGDFGSLERALRRGVAYVNVHTPQFMPGEIRGNIRRG